MTDLTDNSSDSTREAHEAPRHSSPAGIFGRLAAAFQNAVEIARFGGLGEREPSPYEVVARPGQQHHRLRRYFPDAAQRGRPAACWCRRSC